MYRSGNTATAVFNSVLSGSYCPDTIGTAPCEAEVHRNVHKLTRTLCALVAVLFTVIVSAATANAQDGGESVRGVLRYEDTRIEGVTVTVTTPDGGEIGTATSDAEGMWEVPVPGPGDYVVALDEATIPDTVPGAAPEPVNTVVEPGASRSVGFRLGGAGGGQPADPGDSGATPSPSEPGEDGATGTETGDDAEAVPGEDVTATGGSGSSTRWLQLLASGLRFGLILGLAALGLSLVFGTTGLTNFAHGELVTIGAVVALLFNGAGVPLILAAAITLVICLLFGWGQDVGFWRPLRKRNTGLIAMMIISIGVALVLRHLVQFIIGGGRETYDQFVIQDAIDLGPIVLTPRDLVIMAISVALLAAIAIGLTRTRIGKATRAVADNPALAAASGINVDRVITVVWVVGTALAGLSGIFFGLVQGVDYQLGLRVLLLVFAATVLGGLGTAWGAMVGAIVVGVFTELSTLVIPSELKYAGVLLVLIVVLVVRPQGILGRRERVG